MAQSFVKDDADAVCEIQAAHALVRHRDRKTAFAVQFQNVFRQPARFASENEAISGREFPVAVKLRAAGFDVEKTRFRQRGVKPFEIDMTMQPHFFPVIETGAFEGAVVHPEAGRADDVQIGKSRRAEPRDIARVGRNFGFEQGYVKHVFFNFVFSCEGRENFRRRFSRTGKIIIFRRRRFQTPGNLNFPMLRAVFIFFIASILFKANIINLVVLLRKLVPNGKVYVTIRI